MERFIIYSKEYRQHYTRFMKYLHTIGYSGSSCKAFATGIKEFLHWLEKHALSISQVKEKDIERFYCYQQERPNIITGAGLSESRIGLHMYILKLFFNYQQVIEQLEVNPMNELNYASGYKRIRENLLSREDIQKLYDACETARQKALLGMLYGCGLRREEAVKLNTKDIHFASNMLYVREGKGGRKRIIPLSKMVWNDLKEYYLQERPQKIYRHNEMTEAFMLNTKGTRMQGDSYTMEIKKLILKAGLNEKITPHYFRHAIATHLLEGGMKTEHVKDFLGHKSIETTQTYTHITTTHLKKTTAYGTRPVSP